MEPTTAASPARKTTGFGNRTLKPSNPDLTANDVGLLVKSAQRVKVVLAIAFVALASATAWRVWQPGEPVYQGKPLSEWAANANWPVRLSAIVALGAIPGILSRRDM